MKLYKEIIIQILEKEEDRFTDFKLDLTKAFKDECYQALQKIKTIIEDDSLDDDCFLKIEEIVCIFEGLGSDGGNRHDFG